MHGLCVSGCVLCGSGCSLRGGSFGQVVVHIKAIGCVINGVR